MGRPALGASLAAIAALLAIGCGGGSDQSATAPRTGSAGPTTATSPSPAPPRRPGRATHGSRGVTIPLPSGFGQRPKPAKPKTYPVPLAVVSTFPIRRASANTACPAGVLAKMPADGVYMVVAEYTQPPPPGIPKSLPAGPRGDLRKLNIRNEEVECWGGLGGFARFREHGRSFYVEVLLGRGVSAERRRRALDALNRVRVTP